MEFTCATSATSQFMHVLWRQWLRSKLVLSTDVHGDDATEMSGAYQRPVSFCLLSLYSLFVEGWKSRQVKFGVFYVPGHNRDTHQDDLVGFAPDVPCLMCTRAMRLRTTGGHATDRTQKKWTTCRMGDDTVTWQAKTQWGAPLILLIAAMIKTKMDTFEHNFPVLDTA